MEDPRGRRMAAAGVVAALTLLVVLVGLFLWSRSTPPMVDAAAVPEAASPPDRTPVTPAPSEPARPDEAPTEPVASSVEVQALEVVAEVAGEGVIECLLPPDAPPGFPRGFDNAHRSGRRLTARVEAPTGRVVLQPLLPDLPVGGTDEELREWAAIRDATIGIAVWEGAHPGERGRCVVEPVEQVHVVGRIAFLDEPVDGTLHGCGGSFPVDAEGRFSFDIPAGPPCGLSFRDKNVGEPLMIDPLNLPAELIVPEVDRDIVDHLDHVREQLEQLQAMADPYALALEEPELTDEVRALLGEQKAEHDAHVEDRIEHLAFSADFFESALEKRADEEGDEGGP